MPSHDIAPTSETAAPIEFGFDSASKNGAVSSEVERGFHTAEVRGSIPLPPTKLPAILDRWHTPEDWPAWWALLLVEMERHDWPIGRNLNPEDWRDYFFDGYSPHDAIEEDFNYASD